MNENLFADKKFNKIEIVLVLFLAAAFAITRSYTWLNNYLMLDDVNHFLEARGIFASHMFPVAGPQLAGTGARIPGGGYYLLLALPAISFDRPLFFGIYTGILMTCASVFFLFTVRRHFGSAAMFISASLLLFSPRMMLMESGTWNPYYSVILSLFLGAMLLDVFSGRGSPWLLFLILPVSALISQTHFTAFFYLPLVLAVYFIFFYRGSNISFFWLGLFGAALLYLPYIISEIGNHFQNTRAILSMHSGSGGFSFPVLTYLLLFPGLDFMMSGYMYEGFKFLARIPWYAAWPLATVYIISLALPAAAFLYCAKSVIHPAGLSEAGRGAVIFFFLVLGGLVFAFSVFGIPSYPTHYYLPVYAFSFYPLIILVNRLEKWLNKNRAVIYTLCMLFTAAGSALSIYYFTIVIKPFSIQRQYGYINAILDDSEGRPFTVRSEYEKSFYDITAREILHRKWNEKAGAGLSYIIDMKENLTNQGPLILIYGDDLMGVYRKTAD